MVGMGRCRSELLASGEIKGLDDVNVVGIGGGDGDGDGDDGGDNFRMDMDSFLNILQEFSHLSPSSVEDPLRKNSQAESTPQNGSDTLERRHAIGDDESFDPVACYPLYSQEDSDGGIGGSGGSVDNDGNSKAVFCVGGISKVEPLSQTSSGSFKEWCFPLQGDQAMERVSVLQSEMPSCSTMSCFDEGDFEHVAKDGSDGPWMECLDGRFGYIGALAESSFGVSGPENDNDKTVDVPFVDSHNVISANSASCHNSDVTSESSAHYSAMQFGGNADYTFFADSPPGGISGDFGFHLLPNNDVLVDDERNEIAEFQTESACSVTEFPSIEYPIMKGQNFISDGSNYLPPISGKCSSNAPNKPDDNKASVNPFSDSQTGMREKQIFCAKDEKVIEEAAHGSMAWRSFESFNELVNGKYSCSDENNSFGDESLKQASSFNLPSMQWQKHKVHTDDEKGEENVVYMRTQLRGNDGIFPIEGVHLNFNGSSQYLPCAPSSNISNNQLTCTMDKRESKLIQSKGLVSHPSRISPDSFQSSSSGSKSLVDDDSDICILEDISQPACTTQSLVPFVPLGQSPSPVVPLQHCAYGDYLPSMGAGGMRSRPNAVQSIFQAALKDLSQPKSEASPPDGVLAVPLLRHQRIALSWMVQKETSSVCCSGGILADDQGLGKTVSTIALILQERPPPLRVDTGVVKKAEFETLDLDEDDDEAMNVEVKNGAEGFHIPKNQTSTKSMNSFVHSKGRPAAGTLVVCPTSVLRQWAEELQKKVTSKANLSVLVYHGSNRTKDPSELVKYDVVLTTYSIVSMEVPKQPLVDGDDDEKGRREGDDVPHLGLTYGKKRKYPPSSGKKGPKNKKGMDNALLESVAWPLAKVGWFRVVLDEAQSIKNHKTQVARACWGLRAKRRWCLSGTPIQNAIDDLYSYFRFLRYDPYAMYNSFRSTIKVPIQRDPTKGYKMLQAILKRIMLRRTKGTLLDGEPIINLPPKVVELKKVEFSEEERNFYTRLEADSRAQFQEYAAAGTVKQNYVNILLMLLRLRQACDHPLLVRGLDSSSLWRSSIEMAKKLPQEKQIHLLHCLEASLAICGICNDPPEDAVVSVCGHVFCNQCICEHLTGDDHQCPAPSCKVQLNVSSVFSKATLNSFLSDQPGHESSGSEFVETIRAHSEDYPYDSSKIRAALDVLRSLTKPQGCLSTHSLLKDSFNGNASSPDNSSGSRNSQNHDIDRGNSSAKVVGEKAIVFSQWTKMLDLLEACLKHSSIQYRRLDGTMSVVARDKAVKDFNTLPEVSVMIMSLKAASLGLNMVAACRVLLLDLWWNPTTEDQAIDRAHRIGQTRPVTVFRLTVKDTVEDRILALQQKKREMVASAFGEDETGGRQTRLTVEDLNYLFMV